RPRRRVIKAMPPVSPIRRAGAAVSPHRRARPAESNFEDLLRPQVEYLYRLAWRFTGSVADGEDLVQDVLTKLFPRTQELLEIERSEEHTSELQSLRHLVCRLLLEKKKNKKQK